MEAGVRDGPRHRRQRQPGSRLDVLGMRDDVDGIAVVRGYGGDVTHGVQLAEDRVETVSGVVLELFDR